MEGLTELREIGLPAKHASHGVRCGGAKSAHTNLDSEHVVDELRRSRSAGNRQHQHQRPALFAAGWAVVRDGGAWVVLRRVGRLGAALRVLHCGQCSVRTHVHEPSPQVYVSTLLD
jgi:hypothetical protein